MRRVLTEQVLGAWLDRAFFGSANVSDLEMWVPCRGALAVVYNYPSGWALELHLLVEESEAIEVEGLYEDQFLGGRDHEGMVAVEVGDCFESSREVASAKVAELVSRYRVWRGFC